MKQIICLLCCIVFLLSVLTPVAAQVDKKLVEERIIEGLKTEETVDVSEFGLSQPELQQIYRDMFHRGLLPWYTDDYFDWTSAPDGTVSRLTIRDLRNRGYDEEKHERMMAEMIAETCLEGMEPWQKVLRVHDYIVSRAEYSHNLVYNNGYHALVNEKTACYGYAQLFLRIMQRLDIPCQIVICNDVGNGVGHAWNVVQLDGNWYHIDLTWDDPLADVCGRVYYDNFLKTDREFKENGHDFAWETDYTCNDTRFSKDTLWERATSSIQFWDNETVFYRRDSSTNIRIFSANVLTGEETLIYKEKHTYVRMGGASYTYNTMGLQICNGRLWFNNTKSICSINLDGTGKKVEYTHSGKDKALLSFYMTNESLLLSFLTKNGEINRSQESLPYELEHNHNYESTYVAPTCEQSGYRQFLCSCGITYQTEQTAPLGHDTTEQLLEDRKLFTCKHCQYTYEEMLPPQEVPEQNTPNRTSTPVVAAVAVVISGAVGLTVLIKKRKK